MCLCYFHFILCVLVVVVIVVIVLSCICVCRSHCGCCCCFLILLLLLFFSLVFLCQSLGCCCCCRRCCCCVGSPRCVRSRLLCSFSLLSVLYEFDEIYSSNSYRLKSKAVGPCAIIAMRRKSSASGKYSDTSTSKASALAPSYPIIAPASLA